jgi:hypothetical protein
VGGDFVCDAFVLKSGEWNTEGWLKAAQDSPQAAELLVPLISEPQLDDLIRKNPLDLDLLDDFPDLKAGVLRRTGLRDVSNLGKTLRTGII